jgi:hypothetical protein
MQPRVTRATTVIQSPVNSPAEASLELDAAESVILVVKTPYQKQYTVSSALVRYTESAFLEPLRSLRR